MKATEGALFSDDKEVDLHTLTNAPASLRGMDTPDAENYGGGDDMRWSKPECKEVAVTLEVTAYVARR